MSAMTGDTVEQSVCYLPRVDYLAATKEILTRRRHPLARGGACDTMLQITMGIKINSSDHYEILVALAQLAPKLGIFLTTSKRICVGLRRAGGWRQSGRLS
jgi:hypothetical protein